MSDAPSATAATPGPPAPRDSPKARAISLAARRHVVPFAVWIGLLFAVDVFNLGPGDGSEENHALGLVSLAGAYAWRTALGAAALLLWRPWRHYGPLQRRHVPAALLLGIGVYLLWVGFESDLLRRLAPGLAEAYERWAVLPFGALREPLPDPPPYDPVFCGWGLTLVRLAGSAFVIALIEEFFWRGFLYRWIQSLDFLDIDPGRFDFKAFLIVAAVFAAAHNEWLAALVTGLLYGYCYLRTRDLWAVALAHVVTNLLLGIHVLAAGHHQFW